MSPMIQQWIQDSVHSGPGGIMTLLLIAAGTLISEDLACIAAGALIANGTLGMIPGVLAAFTGIYVGDLWLFGMGRWFGRGVLSWRFVHRWIPEDEVRKASELFTRRGPALVFASRFLPGSRLPVYFAAGTLRTRFWSFAGYFALACLVWTPLLVGASMLLQKKLFSVFSGIAGSVSVLIAGAVLLFGITRGIRTWLTYRRRRLLLSAWRRWTRWEFWPLWLFYPPVILHVLGLAIRHRSLTLFALANPGIPCGGFAGESKSDILNSLAGAGEFIAQHELITQGAAEALHHLHHRGWSYPVILKPDQGERGAGVCIARSEEDVHRYFAAAPDRVILQEYVPGFEFGVFYIRHPQEPRGRIFAITDKRFPSVTGDGKRTLEELILSDERAVCMARFHLDRHRGTLGRILADGEELRLVDLGTHCRGSLFLEGMRFHTPELEARIDEISRSFPGFYFGRYDIRTPSLEDFARGRNFKAVELNGVTSEATSIYDPSHSLLHAYRVLFQQWNLAFEIGAENRDRGLIPPGPAVLLGILGDRRKVSMNRATKSLKPITQEERYALDTKAARP